jgi:DNA repair photolyase
MPPWSTQPDGRARFHAGCLPRENVLEALRKEVARNPGDGAQVTLSFTTDPYQPAEETLHITRGVIEILHNGDYTVNVLTKGGLRALPDLPLFTPHDAFGVTLTLQSPQYSAQWEPGAALPAARVAALRAFHDAGIPTWVSLEPVLNPESALAFITACAPFTGIFKIGKLNHYPSLANKIDWRAFALRAVELCERLKARYVLKDDLRAYVK